jgi:hypothetical protein
MSISKASILAIGILNLTAEVAWIRCEQYTVAASRLFYKHLVTLC